MSLGSILTIIETLLASVLPLLEPAELAEIQALEVKYANNPIILGLLKMLAAAVQAQG
jgi:hypothetical protein